jgi:hypothetical protein
VEDSNSSKEVALVGRNNLTEEVVASSRSKETGTRTSQNSKDLVEVVVVMVLKIHKVVATDHKANRQAMADKAVIRNKVVMERRSRTSQEAIRTELVLLFVDVTSMLLLY